MIGKIRDMLTFEGVAYAIYDYPEMLEDMVETSCRLVEHTLDQVLGKIDFDYASGWEDICFKNGPLVSPSVFNELVGPHYKRTTDLLKTYGIDIVSLDCDGMIDSLIPIWLENGVNTMFPIEVGTWGSEIAPWREKYGRSLRGVGGMDKRVFAKDYAAVDAEIERLRRLVDLGGYIPCPDHRIAPDAVWENVQYYCDKFRKTFNK
jgi:uroporphyrinogen decarboxylase